jgi:hypothetical protein
MSAPLKAYRAVVIEWLSHEGMLEAADQAEAEAKAYQLWADNDEHQVFHFEDSGIDGIIVEEVLP